MPDWTIKIVQSSSGTGAKFAPSAQMTQQDDLVCWNNTTRETHQPWPTDDEYNPLDVTRGDGEYLSDPIPAGQSSRPSYDVAQPVVSPAPNNWTVYYYCATHPDRASERGQILAQVVPTSLD